MREISRTTVNAFFPKAEPAFFVKFASALIGEMSEMPDPLELVQKALGGLWVGGTLIVTDGEVRFEPNAMNRLVHRGEVSIAVPLAEIRGATTRFGVLTRIIDVETSAGTFCVRCFGADAVAATIRSAAALAG